MCGLHAAVNAYLRRGWACVLGSLGSAPDSLFFETNTDRHYRVRLASPEEFSELEKRLCQAPDDQMVFIAVKIIWPFLVRRFLPRPEIQRRPKKRQKGFMSKAGASYERA